MTHRAIVENIKVTHAFIRDLADWTRLFASGEDFVGGQIPEVGTTVAYRPDVDSDPRGPRAMHVEIVAAPVAALDRVCPCGVQFQIDAGAQAWLRAKQLHPSRFCPECRQARRKSTP